MMARPGPSQQAMTPWPGLAPWGRLVPSGDRGHQVFLFDSGSPRKDAPSVVLIHGLGDEADTWRHLFPLLARSSRVIALDLPGFGRSPSAGRTNLARCAEAVLGILRELSAGPSILVGSSVGAVIAELAAFREPGSVQALVCVDGGLPQAPASLGAMMPMILPVSGERIYTAYRADHDAAFESLNGYYSDLAALPRADRDFLRKRVIDRVESDTQRRAYFSLLRSLVLWSACRPGFFLRNAAAFGKPLLLSWGEDDRVIPRATMDVLAAAFPRARTSIIRGAGHLPQQERPEELAETIEGFISSL
jgi:pimeloyl-ACP methyl ester carboxylesterase